MQGPLAPLYGFICVSGLKALDCFERQVVMPNGRKRKRKKIATHKRKKRLRKNRHKKK